MRFSLQSTEAIVNLLKDMMTAQLARGYTRTIIFFLEVVRHVKTETDNLRHKPSKMAAVLCLVQQINRISVRHLLPRPSHLRCFHNKFSRHSYGLAIQRLKGTERTVQLQHGKASKLIRLIRKKEHVFCTAVHSVV